MDFSPGIGRQRARWILLGLCLLFFGLIEFASRAGSPTVGGGSLEALPALAAAIPGAAVWTLAVWLAFRATKRLPIGRAPLRRSLVIHASLALGVAVFDLLVTSTTNARLGSEGSETPLTHLLSSLLIYGLLVGVAHAVEYARQYRTQQLVELRLRADLAHAALERTRSELRALRIELKPDFLFTTLDAIRARVRADAAAATRMLLNLSAVLRYGLNSSGIQEMTLEEELQSLEPFLAIEQERLGDALHIGTVVDDEMLDERVPHLILQPMIESAIRRGLASPERTARITIRAVSSNRHLTLEVEDEANGRQSPASRTDRGLRYAEERLHQLHGDAARLTFATGIDGGTRVRALIPLESAEWDASESDWRWDGTHAALSDSPAAPDPSDAGSTAWSAAPRPAVSRRLLQCLGLTGWFVLHTALGYHAWVGVPLVQGGEVSGALATLLSAWGAAALTGLVLAAFWLTRRYPIATGTWLLHAPVLLAAGVLLGAGMWLSRFLVHVLVPYVHVTSPVQAVVDTILRTFPMYVLLLGGAHGVEVARWYGQNEVEELRLREHMARTKLERTQSELRALKMELNPHFVFNALHATHALVQEDAEAAERMLLHLRDLLRQALAQTETQKVTLAEELAGLRPFLEIERLRFGDAFEVQVPLEEELLEELVPHMILQPLVENAIKHGLGPRGGGRIQIAARRVGSRLELTVRDDGAGPGMSASAGTGIGLTNVRERLRQLYGSAADLTLDAAPRGGTAVRLSFPAGSEVMAREEPPTPALA